MQIPKDFLEQQLSQNIKSVTPVSGGSINDVYRLDTISDSFLLKSNNAHRYPRMFEREADALNIISSTKTISAPRVITTGAFWDESFLLLEWIEPGKATPAAMKALGEKLAAMHHVRAGQFGLDHDNYMGSLTQSNKQHSTWSDFFIQERLKPMVEMALKNGMLNKSDTQNFDQLYRQLPSLFEEEQPSLIHGDLWSGNYLIGADGTPYLIDPALSYGNREFDIAMTTLFGGFSNDFYTAYNEAFPLSKGWAGRLHLWNLYPLLVHLNLFGRSYLNDVRNNLSQYL